MGPLEGFRVLDLADVKGELCGRLLADFGAEVIRAEPPSGARSRRLPPFAPDGETSLYFAVRNAGKRGAVVDFGSERGRKHFDSLLAEADVCIESFAPGWLESQGIRFDQHPHLIRTSITDFGCTGPYAGYRGTDMVGFAMGGMMHRAGIFEKPPLVAPGALAYDAAGATAAFATVLGLWQRLRTGRGQHLDVSVMESVANLSDWALPSYSKNPSIGHRAGTGIYSLYRCADGFVRMIVLVKHHWHALLEWMGHPEELADPVLDDFIPRLMNLGRIDPVVGAFFAPQNKIDVAREAQQRGIPATPLLRPSEVLENEHTQARGTFRKIEIAPGVAAQVPSGFFTVDGERLGPRNGPPARGELGAGGFSNARYAPAGDVGGRAEGAPLRDIRVLDLGVGAVGVEVCRLLGDYGADVVKVENSKAPDFIRTIMGTMMNPSFSSSSRGKLGFGVDLKSARGRELVQELARQSDVLVENNGTGVIERLGLGPAELRERNPGLVSFSSQMVGSYGPWKGWIGYGPSTHPVSGLQYLWNFPEDSSQPAGSTNVYPDHLVGRFGAFAVVAGLLQRERTGRGMHADAAQFETAIGLLGDLMAQESLAPGSVQPLGNARRGCAPWGAYACAGDDEWCVVNVRDDAEWEGLRRALGDPAWAARPQLARAEGRIRHAAEIDRELSAWTSQRTPRQAMVGLQACGVPAGIVAHAAHHMADPHLKARGYLLRIEQPGAGSLVLEGAAFHGSALPNPTGRPAPGLGEHTRAIASHRLGLDDAEIDALLEDGTLEELPLED